MKKYPIHDTGNPEYEQALNQAFFDGFICAKVKNQKQLVKMTIEKRIKFCMAVLRKNAFLVGGSSARARERSKKNWTRLPMPTLENMRKTTTGIRHPGFWIKWPVQWEA